MTELPMIVTPDKVAINAYYDEHTGQCTNLEIRLNADGISRDDLTHAVRLAFHAEGLAKPTSTANTLRNHELGGTDIIPKVQELNPHRGQNTSPGATTTRLSMPAPLRG